MKISESFLRTASEQMLNNNMFFSYDVLSKKLCLIYKGEYLVYNDMVDFEKLNLEVDDENIEIVKKFDKLAVMSCSSEQVSFKAKYKGIDRVFLIETFPRNDLDDTVYGMVKNLTNLLLENDRFIELSKKDSLTGLYNRTYIEEYVDELIKTESFFLFAMIDIDFFKDINDSYGHIIGDSVLEEVAKGLMNVAVNGRVGRIGGDEFLVIIPYNHILELKDKRMFAQDVKNVFRNLRNSKINTGAITSTIGICAYPFDGLNFETLYANVDRALYRGKAKGRDCFIAYTPTLHYGIDTKEPLSHGAEFQDQIIDFSIFANNILNSILNNRTMDNIVSKFNLVANYFKGNRITLFERKGNSLDVKYMWSDEEHNDIEPISISDFREFYDELENGLIVVNDLFDYKINREPPINVPYDHGSFVFVPVGTNRLLDVFFCIEIIGARNIWNKNSISNLKIIATFLSNFYQRG